MTIKERWNEYCDWEPQYATHDDWIQFMNLIYADWRNQQIINDPKCSMSGVSQDHDYIQEKYGFHVFANTTAEFCEVENLNAQKFASSRSSGGAA